MGSIFHIGSCDSPVLRILVLSCWSIKLSRANLLHTNLRNKISHFYHLACLECCVFVSQSKFSILLNFSRYNCYFSLNGKCEQCTGNRKAIRQHPVSTQSIHVDLYWHISMMGNGSGMWTSNSMTEEHRTQCSIISDVPRAGCATLTFNPSCIWSS